SSLAHFMTSSRVGPCSGRSSFKVPDNCAKWILKIAESKNLTINLRHLMDFGKDTKFTIVVGNSGEIVHSMKELIPVASEYLNKMKQE
ncbi:hypothetical protein BRYFOR_09464, partial [Marvinbryantia formatexigens DSM 14469]